VDVQIKEMPGIRTAAVRHVGPYNQISQAYEKLGAAAGPSGLFGRPGAMMIGIYYDDPRVTPAAQLRSDAALSVAEDMPIPQGLVEARIPSGRYAYTLHEGPYERLKEAWARLMAWLPAHGYRPRAGASYEIYRNTPETASGDALRTELYLPID
jgi:AraC family transcriptional regulator